ncbi:hypothetical protein [Mucilaginibacter jinjuensis]|uniref:Lumazine-binding protein n=1 Tax=Mucilaginibacter jinjuensis TaxID=1176721 RepID=A0ABY7T7F1_9SPHI|nr:hypothetical protein [Mucilaginibacter jinjuensis]WCT11167.1 hypothetical protein PQO05_20725 [Mucilaginibacter jinjuensis]
MKNLIYVIVLWMLLGCNHKSTAINDTKDTVDLLKSVLLSKQFIRTLTSEKDTIYILKTKFYRKSWPLQIGQHQIVYIDDNQQARTISTYPHVDGRMRYGISDFKINKDSAVIMIWQFTTPIYIRYHFEKNTGSWKIKSHEMGIQ